MNIQNLQKILKDPKKLEAFLDQPLDIVHEKTRIALLFTKNFKEPVDSDTIVIPSDVAFLAPEKVVSILNSRLGLNKKVFARKCEVEKTSKALAEEFLEKFHLMGKTSSAFNLGLFLKEELLAVASFSKGRKMNRLDPQQRSFELIRFCCKPGITVTGGLTKLVKNFCNLKKAGDVMTYVDKQLSDGRSFIKAGFKKHSETGPNYFLVNKITFERTLATKDELFDKEKFYLAQNAGNIKLVYTPFFSTTLEVTAQSDSNRKRTDV